MRKLTTSRRVDASSMTTYLPRLPMAAMRSPASCRANEGRLRAMTTLGRYTSAPAIVLPAIVAARPRAIVSASGSSGTVWLLGRVQSRQLEVQADPQTRARGFTAGQLDDIFSEAVAGRDALVRRRERRRRYFGSDRRDRPVGAHEDHVERDQRVLHPEALRTVA